MGECGGGEQDRLTDGGEGAVTVFGVWGNCCRGLGGRLGRTQLEHKRTQNVERAGPYSRLASCLSLIS